MEHAQTQPQPGDLSWRLSSHPITLLTFLFFRICAYLHRSPRSKVGLLANVLLQQASSSLRSQTLHQKLVRLASQTSAQNHPVPALRPLCSLILPPHPPSQPTKLTRNPSSVLIFIITILLLAADFYYLKNIAGRRLVGLRWWNEVDTATGDSRWVFESADPETRTINATDKRFFWLALYAQPVLWVVLAIVALASFEPIWLTLVGELLPTLAFRLAWNAVQKTVGWYGKSLDSGCWRRDRPLE
jgi:hypothetical protein